MKWFAIFGSIGLVVIAISILIIMHPLCGEELLNEKVSPDGRYVAALMSRSCGATASDVAHINLRLAHRHLGAGFFTEATGDVQVWSSSKYTGTRFCWSSPARLEIGYPLETGHSVQGQWRDVIIGNNYQSPNCQ